MPFYCTRSIAQQARIAIQGLRGLSRSHLAKARCRTPLGMPGTSKNAGHLWECRAPLGMPGAYGNEEWNRMGTLGLLGHSLKTRIG